MVYTQKLQPRDRRPQTHTQRKNSSVRMASLTGSKFAKISWERVDQCRYTFPFRVKIRYDVSLAQSWSPGLRIVLFLVCVCVVCCCCSHINSQCKAVYLTLAQTCQIYVISAKLLLFRNSNIGYKTDTHL